jgi:CMP-N-acetylneuraminic acid synthetase
MKKRIVALLPMKANSQRVKGKNFRVLEGKPLFRWILDSLLELEEIDEVVINTDARHILAENGLTDSARVVIRDRKPEICGDLVSMNRVIEDDVENVEADAYLMTHTTNPFLSAKTIRNALQAFKNGSRAEQTDSLFTVNKLQSRFYRADASAINHDPANLIPTQELEPWFEENSNLYIFTRDSFASTNARIGLRPMLYETPKLESVDIDTPEDWEFAAIVAKCIRQTGAA